MFDIIRERLRQGHRTARYPLELPVLPDRFRGLPVLDAAKCESGCSECARVCPNDAIAANDKGFHIDLGRCLFCTECTEACPTGAIRYTTDHRLAVRRREDLHRTAETYRLAEALEQKTLRLFGRSLKLRVGSAGGGNGWGGARGGAKTG